MCDTGQALAHEVVNFVYYGASGKIYSRKTDGQEPIRVEVPNNYSHTKDMLVASAPRELNRQVTCGQSPSANRLQENCDEDRKETIDCEADFTCQREKPFHARSGPLSSADRGKDSKDPAHAEPDDTKHEQRATDNSEIHSAAVAKDDIVAGPRYPEARPGSLYEADIQRLRKSKEYRYAGGLDLQSTAKLPDELNAQARKGNVMKRIGKAMGMIKKT